MLTWLILSRYGIVTCRTGFGAQSPSGSVDTGYGGSLGGPYYSIGGPSDGPGRAGPLLAKEAGYEGGDVAGIDDMVGGWLYVAGAIHTPVCAARGEG